MPAEPAIKQDIRFCTAPDDVRLAYAISGDGPPLVMSIHVAHRSGVPDRGTWSGEPWLEAFSADHKLLSYDLRGCGLSNRNPAELSLEAWIRDFESVVDAADFKQFSILATCQHGPVAIEYAAKHPERVRKIVLYCTYARGRMKRPDRPFETEKTRVAASLVRTGWAQDDALLQIWAHAFQPERLA